MEDAREVLYKHGGTSCFQTGATAWRKHPLTAHSGQRCIYRSRNTEMLTELPTESHKVSAYVSVEILVSNRYLWLARGWSAAAPPDGGKVLQKLHVSDNLLAKSDHTILWTRNYQYMSATAGFSLSRTTTPLYQYA